MPQIRVPIVGNKHYPGSEETLKELPVGTPIVLVREPENRVDPRAVACYEPDGDADGYKALGRKLGFIPANLNADISAAMDAGRAAYATLIDPPQGREPARIIVSWE